MNRRQVAMPKKRKPQRGAPPVALRPRANPRANKVTGANAYEQAIGYLRNKEPEKAIPLLAAVTEQASENPDAWHMFGVAMRQSGQPGKAIELISKALALRPTYAEAIHNLGNALTDLGRNIEAVSRFREAIALRPDYFDAHVNLGAALVRIGEAAEAVTAYKTAIALDPSHPELYIQLANVLRSTGDIEGSVHALAKAQKLGSNNPALIASLAAAQRASGRHSDALTVLNDAYGKFPNAIDIILQLAALLEERGERGRAEKIYTDALAASPRSAELHCNYGLLLHVVGRFAEAEKEFRQAIEIAPDLAHAHWNLANTLLITGRIGEGFQEYDWRWRRPEVRHHRKDDGDHRWRGEPLDGKHIVIFPDQGFGDTVHFARYIPLLAAKGARVTFQVQKELLTLLQASLTGPKIAIVSAEEPIPACDFTCPILSLPGAFATDERSIPAKVPYITPPPPAVAKWRTIIERLTKPSSLRVGLIWAGNPKFRRDFSRSPGIEAMLDLFTIPDISLFLLQLGRGRGRLGDIILPDHVHDLGPSIQDFADTAAIMENLDLIISSCTAPAHIAGALSRPLWLMLETVPDWRWLASGETSAWYPTARLFRKRADGDWSGLTREVGMALRERL